MKVSIHKFHMVMQMFVPIPIVLHDRQPAATKHVLSSLGFPADWPLLHHVQGCLPCIFMSLLASSPPSLPNCSHTHSSHHHYCCDATLRFPSSTFFLLMQSCRLRSVLLFLPLSLITSCVCPCAGHLRSHNGTTCATSFRALFIL